MLVKLVVVSNCSSFGSSVCATHIMLSGFLGANTDIYIAERPVQPVGQIDKLVTERQRPVYAQRPADLSSSTPKTMTPPIHIGGGAHSQLEDCEHWSDIEENGEAQGTGDVGIQCAAQSLCSCLGGNLAQFSQHLLSQLDDSSAASKPGTYSSHVLRGSGLRQEVLVPSDIPSAEKRKTMPSEHVSARVQQLQDKFDATQAEGDDRSV